jgi:ribonuclease HI
MPWERRRYRRNKVWVRVDDAGHPVLDARGLAALRFRPADPRTYSVRAQEVGPLGGLEPTLPADLGPGSDPAWTVVLYVDGASSGDPGPAGLGAVLRWRSHRRDIQRFLDAATREEAELRAALAALEAVTRPDLRVELHTDSACVLGVLAEGRRIPAHEDLARRLRAEAARFDDLHLVRSAAHAGAAGPERADRLARDAIRRGASA